MSAKPRVQVFGPIPEVTPGLELGRARGFSTDRRSAERTPIRLRITSGAEQPIMFFLSWKSTASLPINTSDLIDAPMRRRLFDRGGGRVVLSGEAADMAALVTAIKAEYPALKVLIYTNAQRVPESSKTSGRMFAHFLANQGELLQKVSGGAKILGAVGARQAWVDIGNASAVAYIASECVAIVDDYGADGIFIDSYHTEIPSTNSIVDGDTKNTAMPAAAIALLEDIRDALDLEFGAGIKEIWINGLWNQQDDLAHPSGLDQVERQATLIPYVDGMTAEMFGRSGLATFNAYFRPGADGYRVQAEEIAAVIAANPTFPVLVRGTAPDAYYDYVQDLANGRYSYACYLCLAWTAATTFQFHHLFNLTRLTEARTYGNAVHSCLDLPLGAPEAAAVDDGDGGLSREFEGGWVFLAPDGSGLHVWTLSEGLYTPLGQYLPVGTALTLPEGEALILVKKPLPPHPYRCEANLDDSDEEFLMEPTMSEYRYTRIKGRARGGINSAILVRVQVNETNRPFAALRIVPVGGTAPSLVTKDYVYGVGPSQQATHKTVNGYVADGQWHNFDIELASAMAPLEHFQIPSIRLIDDAEVEALELYAPEPVIGEIDLAAPTAFFSLAHDNLSVTPTDASIAPVGETIVSWSWEWGDGATSAVQNPGPHVYQYAGGKQLTLTVVASNGRSASYTATARPGVNSDGPLKVSFPFTQAEFVATRTMPAHHAWDFSLPTAGAPNALDIIATGAAVNLAAALIAAYQQATGIAGWTRTGAKFDETISQYFRNTAPGFDPAVVEEMLVLAVYLETPAAVRVIASLAATQSVDVRHLGTGKLRINSGGNSADGTAVYDGDVYLIALLNRPQQSTNAYETNLNTPTPVTVANGIPAGDDIYIGVLGTGAFKGIALAAWLWRARTFTVAGDVATVAGHGLQTGNGPVTVYNAGGALPGGIATATDYWIIRDGVDTFRFAASADDAADGVAVTLAGAGTGTHYVRAIPTPASVFENWGWIEPPAEAA